MSTIALVIALLATGDAVSLTCTGTTAYNETALFIETGKRIERTGSITIHIGGGEDRIKLPREIYSKHNEGKDGWFPLFDVVMNPDEIRARARLNAYNKPKITLDRRAGTVVVTGGLGDFSGQCRKFDPTASERQF